MSAQPPQMIIFSIPADEALLAAIGRVTIAHSILDQILRMTVKSITGVEVAVALSGTARDGSAELREQVRKLAKKRIADGPALLRLKALLERARSASQHRNDLVHNLWKEDPDGTPVMLDQRHQPQRTPVLAELENLTSGIGSIVAELNQARLRGFLFEAINSTKPPKGW